MVEIRVTGGGPGARGIGGSVPAHGVRCARYILWIRAILGGGETGASYWFHGP